MRQPNQQAHAIIATIILSIKKLQEKDQDIPKTLDSETQKTIIKFVEENKEITEEFFFTGSPSCFDELINSLCYQCIHYNLPQNNPWFQTKTFDSTPNEVAEKNIKFLSTLLFHLIEEHADIIPTYLTAKSIETLLNGITLLLTRKINEESLIHLLTKTKDALDLATTRELTQCDLLSSKGDSISNNLIDRLATVKKNKKVFNIAIDIINKIIPQNKQKAFMLFEAINLLKDVVQLPDNFDCIDKLVELISHLTKNFFYEIGYDNLSAQLKAEQNLLELFSILSLKTRIDLRNAKIISQFTLNYLEQCIKHKLIRAIFPCEQQNLNNALFTITTALHAAIRTKSAELTEIIIKIIEKTIGASTPENIFRACNMSPPAKVNYVSEFSGVAFLDREEIKHNSLNCFNALFDMAKLEFTQKNISFVTFFFETLLDRLDNTPQETKDQISELFKINKESYFKALIFYLSNMNPDKLKKLFEDDKILSRIIKHKSFFSRKSHLHATLEIVQHHKAAGFDGAKQFLQNALRTEIHRLREKKSVNDDDIEISNLFVKIKLALKKPIPELNRETTEALLNTYLEQLESPHLTSKMSTESKQLIMIIKLIAPWYLTEKDKDYLACLHASIAGKITPLLIQPPLKLTNLLGSTDSFTAEIRQQALEACKDHDYSPTKPKEKEAEATPCKYEARFFQQVEVTPQDDTPKRSATTATNSFSANIAAVQALQVPTHPVFTAQLVDKIEVPSGPIAPPKKDIVDELFGFYA